MIAELVKILPGGGLISGGLEQKLKLALEDQASKSLKGGYIDRPSFAKLNDFCRKAKSVAVNCCTVKFTTEPQLVV